MLSLPAEWVAELKDQSALITDPDGRAAVLSEMAFGAYRRGEASDDDLSAMLEMVEAGRWWAMSEIEEAFGRGLEGSLVRQDVGSG